MIDTTTSAVATGVVVTAGQWAKEGKGPSIKVVVGMVFLAYMLSIISAGNQKLGSQFAALILVGAVLVYAVPIAKKLGYSK